MEAHLIEWLNLLVRWIHMIVGIAWIGASFYFVWLENNLNRSNPREGLSGDLWAIHGGGIYHLEKYKLAPPKMPENLHWFKWEAYSTWMSGVVLLTIVFYLNPTLYLIAPGSDLAPAAPSPSVSVRWSAAGSSTPSSAIRRWARPCPARPGPVRPAGRRRLRPDPGVQRPRRLHVGAIIGTIMVGNVFRVIMPAQRALVKAIEENREPDPVLPAKGLLRSRHNNYFTLPVLFIMISNHFPSTYGSQYNWLILAAIAVLAVLVRHYFNTRHESNRFAWALPAGAGHDRPGLRHHAELPAGFRAAGQRPAAAPAQPATGGDAPAAPAATQASNAGAASGADFDKVHHVIQERCTVCHSAKPTSQLFSTAPGGIMLDTPQQIQQLAPKIQAQAVASQIMPLGNITQMTQEERNLIGSWIAKGAQIN